MSLAVITGMQRSGTSILANYCKRLGFDLGTDFWHGDINGGLESPDICLFYRQCLDDDSFPFDDFYEAVCDDIDQPVNSTTFENLGDKYRIQKFSYLLMNPRFVDIWNEYRGTKDDRFIILMRDTEHIYMSKHKNEKRRKRFEGDSDYLKQTPMEMKCSFHESLMKMVEYNMHFTFLTFPDYLNNYNSVHKALVDSGLKIEYDADSFYELVDQDKISFR